VRVERGQFQARNRPTRADTDRMGVDLAPLRRTEELLAAGETTDAIVEQLRMLFGLNSIDAMAAIAAVTLLNERELSIPDERTTWQHPSSSG